MNSQDAVRRKILTYALISQNFQGRRDPVAALFPLFAPIASDLAGHPFDAASFQTEMRDRYAMDLSRDVVDLFAQRLSQLRLLSGESQRLVWNASNIPAHNQGTADIDKIERLLTAAAAHHESKQDLLKHQFDEDKFLEALMRLVLDTQQAVQSAVEAATADGAPVAFPSKTPKIRDAEQYFAASFVAWCKDNDKEMFKWIADLGGAVIVSEALVEVRNPTFPTNVTPDLTVYLDTPFLMELLGCSGTAAREDAKYIVDTLKGIGVRISVLAHLIDELRFNLKAVLKTPAKDRTGPSAAALLFREVTQQHLEHVLEDPEYYISEAGITSIDIKKTEHLISRECFTESDEQSYFASIQSQYNHVEAALRDSASVAWIMRRRKGDQSRDVLKAKHILLTRNKLIYRRINRFCLDKGYVKPGTAGPVVLARDLAGILWLLSGSDRRSEISQRQLLLSCQRAKANAPEIVNAMVQMLSDVNPESAELFMVAVNKPAYLSLALDTVAEAPNGVSKQISETTLERIRDDLISEERERGKEKLNRTKERYERDGALKDVVIESLKGDAAKLGEERLQHIDAWGRIANMEWKSGARLAKALHVGGFGSVMAAVVLLSAVAVIATSALISVPDLWRVFGALVAACVAAFLTWLVAPSSIRKWAEAEGQKVYRKRLIALVPEVARQDVETDEPMTSSLRSDSTALLGK